MLFPTALFFYETSHSKLCRVISWLVYCIFCAVTFCNRRLWQESGCSCGDSSLLLMEKADVIFARPWCFYKKQLTLCITWDKVVKFRVQVSNLVNIWCHPPLLYQYPLSPLDSRENLIISFNCCSSPKLICNLFVKSFNRSWQLQGFSIAIYCRN